MAIVEKGKKPTPLEFQALKVAGKEADQVRSEVSPGKSQEVDFRVQIVGTLDVGEGTLRATCKKPRIEDLLGRILDRLKYKSIDSPDALHRFFRHIRGGLGEPEPDSLELAQRILESFTDRGREPANGPVKGALTLIRL